MAVVVVEVLVVMNFFRDYGISIPWPKTGLWNIRSMAQDGTMEYPFHGPRRWNIHSICSAITWNIDLHHSSFVQLNRVLMQVNDIFYPLKHTLNNY